MNFSEEQAQAGFRSGPVCDIKTTDSPKLWQMHHKTRLGEKGEKGKRLKGEKGKAWLGNP
jgi:hypothetical protein